MIEKQRQLLIELRSQLIGEKNTLPYCIYTDETIEQLLKAQPKTISELVKVKGFPAQGKRVKGFGEAVVAIFADTEKIENFSLIKGKNAGEFEVGTKLRRVSAF